jgi:hypothetical protein
MVLVFRIDSGCVVVAVARLVAPSLLMCVGEVSARLVVLVSARLVALSLLVSIVFRIETVLETLAPATLVPRFCARRSFFPLLFLVPPLSNFLLLFQLLLDSCGAVTRCSLLFIVPQPAGSLRGRKPGMHACGAVTDTSSAARSCRSAVMVRSRSARSRSSRLKPLSNLFCSGVPKFRSVVGAVGVGVLDTSG